MCFSAEMDLVAGIAITTVGIDAARHVTHRSQAALAAIPLLLGVHQLIETLVWWDLEGRVSACAGDTATWLYLLIALTLMPIAVPLAFLTLRMGRSVAADWAFLAIGGGVGLVLFAQLGLEAPGRYIDGHHIAYRAGIAYDWITLPLYVVATCGPALLARSRRLQAFGLLNLVAVGVIAWISQTAVVSIWCVWAAFTSVLINLHLRDRSADRS